MLLIIPLFYACNSNGIKDKEEVSVEKIKDDIRFRVYSKQDLFGVKDQIYLFYEYEYIGDKEEIIVYHVDEAVLCDLFSLDGKYELTEDTTLNNQTSVLKKNEVYKFLFIPNNKIEIDDSIDLRGIKTFKLKQNSYKFKAYVIFGYTQESRIDLDISIEFSVK